MQLLELSLQGVRSFAPSIRVQLQPGYWVLQPSVSGNPPLGSLLNALFFSDGRGGDKSFAVPEAKDASAGVMLQGNDHGTYWLVRTLGHSGELHRYLPTTQGFEKVSSEATEITSFIRAQLGLPPKAAMENLFTFQLSQLPTHRPKTRAAPAAAAAPAKPSLASAVTVAPADDIPAAQQKLAELEKERALSEDVDKVQYQLDGVASRVFALESKLKETDALRSQVNEAKQALRTAPTPESLGLPPDILSRVERYPQLVAKRDEALAKLEAERADETPASVTVDPFWKDARFWAPVGAGIAFLIGGAIASGLVRYVALLDIPSFGISALIVLRYLDERERAERGSRRGSRMAEREQKILDTFESESKIVREAMKALNVDAPEGITEALAQGPLLHERYEALQRKLQETEGTPEFSAARQELTELKAQQLTLDAELTQKGAYVRDGREVEREIARVKESIALAQAPASAPKAVVAAAPVVESIADPAPQLLSLAADLLTMDLPTVSALIKERVLQYTSAFTDRRVTGLETDILGKTTAVTPNGKVPLGELSGSDVDLVYLAIRFAVLEKYSMKFRVPVVIEDVMAGLEPQQLSLMARVLKGLGKLTQVLHVTERAEFVEASDGQLKI